MTKTYKGPGYYILYSYFTKPPYLGVSVFRKVDNAEEGQRGACMRSIGVMVEPNANTGPNAKVWIHGHALNLLAQ